MTTSDLGRVRPIYRGAYSPTASYTPLDFLSYDGNMYFCTLATTGIVPTDAGYFQPVIDASWLVTLSKFNADVAVLHDEMAEKADKAVQIRAGKGLKLDGQSGTDTASANGDLSVDRLLGLNLAAFALAQAVWNAGISTDEAPISPAKVKAAIIAAAGPIDPGVYAVSSYTIARTNGIGVVSSGGTLPGGNMQPAVWTPEGLFSSGGILPGSWRNVGGPIATGGYGIFQRIV